MRTRVRRCGAVLAVGAWVLLSMVTPSYAANAETFHYTVDGVAAVQGSTCPFGVWPAEDTECEDWLALLYRSTPGSPQHHNRTPWRLELVRARVLVHPNQTVEVLSEAFGIAEQLDEVTFDERRLVFASVQASVPMSDGSTRDVALSWDGKNSPLRTDGNNGPYNQGNGIDRHHVDRCITANAHAHQTYRANVVATGTIDGTGVEDLPYLAPFDPFIGRGHFNFVFVRHGGCDASD